MSKTIRFISEQVIYAYKNYFNKDLNLKFEKEEDQTIKNLKVSNKKLITTFGNFSLNEKFSNEAEKIFSLLDRSLK